MTPVLSQRLLAVTLLCSALLFSGGCKNFRSGRDVTVTMVVSADEFLKERSNDPNDVGLLNALTCARSAHIADYNKFVNTFAACYFQDNPGASLAKLFAKPYDRQISLSSSNYEVTQVLAKELHDAGAQTYHALQVRAEKISVGKTTMAYDENTGTIKALLNTDYDVERIRDFLASRGDLQFYETYTNEQLASVLMSLNDRLANKDPAPEKKPAPATIKQPKGNTKSGDTTSIDHYVSQGRQAEADTNAQRAEEFTRTNPFFAVLNPNIDGKSNQFIPGPIVGYIRIADLPKLNIMMSTIAAKETMPGYTKLMPGVPDRDDRNRITDKTVLPVYAVKLPHDGVEPFNGSCIAKAHADKSSFNGMPVVVIDMTVMGAHKWKAMTAKCTGGYIALSYNGRVFSCPRVEGEISSATTEISGSFTKEQAEDLANVLSCGKLAAPVHVTEISLAKGRK